MITYSGIGFLEREKPLEINNGVTSISTLVDIFLVIFGRIGAYFK